MATPILLVGNVLVDVFNLPGDAEKRLRFGGITHAARVLWGLGVEYNVAYMAPTYLHSELEKYLSSHGAGLISCVGEVMNSPNIILIDEPTEAGDQGYEVLLREIKNVTLRIDNLNKILEEGDCSDILFFPEVCDPPGLIKALSSNKTSTLHIDANNVPGLIDSKGEGGAIKIGSLFLSTSSSFFYPEYVGLQKLKDNVLSFCDEFILKENRGGSRVFVNNGEEELSIPSFPRTIVHSVGVGDGYDATYIALRKKNQDELALRTSSLIAACYAATTFIDDIKDDMQRCIGLPNEDIMAMRGVCLPWEEREKLNIYIAAPDFDYVNKPELDYLIDCLKYHNFTARLPVRENGQATGDSTIYKKRKIFSADLKIMEDCSLMIAVLLYNDQGTLVEIGIAKERGMAVILYDPRKILDNLFLEMVPDIITTTVNETIEATFSILGEKYKK